MKYPGILQIIHGAGDSDNMSDIRDTVEDDRGILKKIQGFIPGYKGYREREDLRIADSLLRNQLANEMDNVVESTKRSREVLTKNMEMDLMGDIGSVVNNMEALANKIRHAQQGYSGFSADVRIEQDELNRLYEWDLNLLEIIGLLREKSTSLEGLVSQKSPDMSKGISDLRSEMDNFNVLFKKRMDTISGTSIN
jgi:hypothetical protein